MHPETQGRIRASITVSIAAAAVVAMTRTIWLLWAFGFLTVYGTLADRWFLLGAAAVAAVLAVRDLAAFRRRR